jgi:hypothetical protein
MKPHWEKKRSIGAIVAGTGKYFNSSWHNRGYRCFLQKVNMLHVFLRVKSHQVKGDEGESVGLLLILSFTFSPSPSRSFRKFWVKKIKKKILRFVNQQSHRLTLLETRKTAYAHLCKIRQISTATTAYSLLKMSNIISKNRKSSCF